MIVFKNTKKNLTVEEIQSFETTQGFSLPNRYIAHILKYNGGYPINKKYFGNYKIHNFLAIKYGDDSVEENIKNLSEIIKGKFLPFGDSMGGVLYISFNKKDYGKIYVIYSDGQTDFLAESFKEFMEGLTEEES